MQIRIENGLEYQDKCKELFEHYRRFLEVEDPLNMQYLQLQNYASELQDLDKKYGTPVGRLYIAFVDDMPAGCIGLRKMREQVCEMKRLFVEKEYRGLGIGDRLVQTIIEAAKEIGYEEMYLDTMPSLKSAVHLYYKYGFLETEKYNDSPIADTIFMKLDLKK